MLKCASTRACAQESGRAPETKKGTDLDVRICRYPAGFRARTCTDRVSRTEPNGSVQKKAASLKKRDLSAIRGFRNWRLPDTRNCRADWKLMSTSTIPDSGKRSEISVVLTNHQIALLDEIAAAIRRRTGAVLSRSAMLRATLAAILPHGKEVLDYRSEAELKQAISERLVIAASPAAPAARP